MKSRLITLFVITLTTLFVVPNLSFAALFDLDLGEIFIYILRAVGNAASFVVGLGVSFAASLVNLMFNLNLQVLSESNSIVQTGWNITRDIANLGFVLAIIIIAFATIIRYREYGARQLLTKLIAAALIVNFSLVIVGVFLDFSNTLTNFFISSRLDDTSEIASTVAAAFEIQSLFIEQDVDLQPTGDEAGGLISIGVAALSSIAGLFFSIIFTLLVGFVLLALALMLLVRFVYLTLLAILAPLAWLFWVIPSLSGQFKKWWHKFMQWTFFAPAVSFFLYLTLLSTELLSNNSAALRSVGSNFASAPLQQLMIEGSKMVVLAGLLVGGLMAAQSMSITGAKGAVSLTTGLAQRAGKGARSFATRKARQYATGALRSVGAAEKVQGAASKTTAGQWLLGRTGIARGIAALSTTGGENVVKDYEKQVGNMSTASAKASLITATGPRKIALVKKLLDDGKLDDDSVSRLLTQGNKRLFDRFSEGGTFKKLQQSSGMDVAMNEKLQQLGTGSQEDQTKRRSQIESGAANMVKGLTKKDAENTSWKTIFGKLDTGAFGLNPEQLTALAESLAQAVATENSPLTSGIIPKLDAKGRNNFVRIYKQGIQQQREKADTLPTEEREQLLGQLEKAEKSFEKTIANFMGEPEKKEEKKTPNKTSDENIGTRSRPSKPAGTRSRPSRPIRDTIRKAKEQMRDQ